jgi:hypothetical protein
MTRRKAFFRDRTAWEIKGMKVKSVNTQRNLVKRIMDLDPNEDALELRVRVIPHIHFRNVTTVAEAGRKLYKFGNLVPLSQPENLEIAYKSRKNPLDIRRGDFTDLERIDEIQNNFIGYSFRPVQGRDRRKRIVPFVWLLEAFKLFSYSETTGVDKKTGKGSIVVEPYSDALRVANEGAKIVCKIPSRTQKKSRYVVRLENVPVRDNSYKRAIIWGVKSNFDQHPMHSNYNLRFTWETGKEGSDVFTWYPHDIAAYIASAKKFRTDQVPGNIVPLQMCPFPLISRLEGDFYRNLCNNVLIFDPTLKSKEKLRNLNIGEKSILISRSISVMGHDETMYWDASRDGKLKDYDWGITV